MVQPAYDQRARFLARLRPGACCAIYFSLIDFFKRNISPLSFLVMVSHVKIRFNPTEIDQKANKLTMSPIPKNPKE